MWKKIVEKVVDAKAKTSLKLSFGTRKINFRYQKEYKLLIKKNKDKLNQKNWDKDKIKLHNLSLTNANQSLTQASKKTNAIKRAIKDTILPLELILLYNVIRLHD